MYGKKVVPKLARLLCPILLPSRLIGCLPCEASFTSQDAILRPSRRWFITTLVAFTLHICSFTTHWIDLSAGGKKGSLHDTLASLSFFSRRVVGSINFLLNVWRTKHICKCFNDAVRLIADMSDIHGIAFRWTVPAIFVWVTSATAALITSNIIEVTRHETWYYTFILSVHVLVNWATEIQYSLLCVLISGVIGMLRYAVSTLQFTVTAWPKNDTTRIRPAELVSTIEWIRLWHSALHSLVRRVHSGYGVQLLLSLGSSQTTLIITLYDMVVSMIHGKFNLLTAYAMSLCATQTVSICVWASIATYQLRKLVEEIGRIETTHWTAKSKKKWQLLLNQIDSLKMRFEATGMVTISTDLLISVAASTSTYFIVLIQFED